MVDVEVFVGRKNVLVLCMLLMGASTFAIALLPTYASIGIWAPAILVALRLIQGFAVGGELAGASAMIVEHLPFGRRGYYASLGLTPPACRVGDLFDVLGAQADVGVGLGEERGTDVRGFWGTVG